MEAAKRQPKASTNESNPSSTPRRRSLSPQSMALKITQMSKQGLLSSFYHGMLISLLRPESSSFQFISQIFKDYECEGGNFSMEMVLKLKQVIREKFKNWSVRILKKIYVTGQLSWKRYDLLKWMAQHRVKTVMNKFKRFSMTRNEKELTEGLLEEFETSSLEEESMSPQSNRLSRNPSPPQTKKNPNQIFETGLPLFPCENQVSAVRNDKFQGKHRKSIFPRPMNEKIDIVPQTINKGSPPKQRSMSYVKQSNSRKAIDPSLPQNNGGSLSKLQYSLVKTFLFCFNWYEIRRFRESFL